MGWALGFMISALIVLVGLFVAASGLPFYRTQKPNGSPLKGILQVKLHTEHSMHANYEGSSTH